MTPMQLWLCASAASRVALHAQTAMRAEMLRHLAKRSGKLWESVQCHWHVKPAGDGATVWLTGHGGGASAFYGILLEHGTGERANSKADVEKGYEGPDGTTVPFFSPRRAKGYLILRRSGPMAGTPISRGITPRPWFGAVLKTMAEFVPQLMDECAASIADQGEDWLR